MKKDGKKGRSVRRAAACTAALTMALQLCCSFPSLAYYSYGSSYDSDYPYQDDPDYGSSYYWDESGRKVTNVTRTYDDGTTYKAQYKYDALGHLVYSNVRKPDGSKMTRTVVYNGELLVSESTYEYDGSSKLEVTSAVEYGAEGWPAHAVRKDKYQDGTSESMEAWYLSDNVPLKVVLTDRAGVVTQRDYTYDGEGRRLAAVSAGTDGSFSQEEWQYGEEGEAVYSKSSQYDGATQTAKTGEMRYEGEGDLRCRYTTEAVGYPDGTIYKSEIWRRAVDDRVVKQIVTDVDGTQTTENYSYDPEGNETLYTKTEGDRILEKRETTLTDYGSRVVEMDSRGYSSISSTSYDPKTGKTTIESTMNGPDGDSTYNKVIRGYDYTTEYNMYRVKYEDGTESYYEMSYNSDGGITKTEGAQDGSTTVTTYDALGNQLTSKETLADGTYSETTWETREDGQIASEVKRYSNGAEDRIDYQYNEAGKVVRETESRSNGVVAVSEYQYNPENGYMTALTVTFNNGYQLAGAQQVIEGDREEGVISYSVGDLAQVALVYYEDGRVVGKNIYRDGRTEDFSINLYDYESYTTEAYEKLEAVQEYFDSYLEQAWNTPVQTAQPDAGQDGQAL